MIKPIEIDGSSFEGGGALLRCALALSTLTKKPFRMSKIRANRKDPGLKQQHLTCIKALQELTKAKCTDARVGSEEILFIPGETCKSTLTIDAKTAASLTLILQALVPALCTQEKQIKLTLRGGTDVPWSPGIDYFMNVYSRAIDGIVSVQTLVQKRGYAPKGEGELKVTLLPHTPKPLDFTTRSFLDQITSKVHASRELESKRVAERISQAISTGFLDASVSTSYVQSESIGCGVTLVAHHTSGPIGVCILGEKRVTSEELGERAVTQMKNILSSTACVDEHLADQLIIFLAMFGGEIQTNTITNHTRANMYVCEQFLDTSFQVTDATIKVEK